MTNLQAQIQQLEKEKKDAPEEEQFSYTTQIQSAQMDLKKSEYDRKAKEVEINRIQSQIDNSTVTSEMKGVVKSVQNQDQEGSNMYGDPPARPLLRFWQQENTGSKGGSMSRYRRDHRGKPGGGAFQSRRRPGMDGNLFSSGYKEPSE